MNINEGARRIALIGGALGFILGGFFSYSDMRNLSAPAVGPDFSKIILIVCHPITGFALGWSAVMAVMAITGWVYAGFHKAA